MTSLDRLSLEQLGRWEDVHPFASSDVETPGCVPGAPPIFRPRMADTAGTGYPGIFLQILDFFREQDLGDSIASIGAKQSPVSQGGHPFTATQGYLVQVPRNFPVPPAWAISTSPDNEQRYGSPSKGTY